jgi:hypothetical protein
MDTVWQYPTLEDAWQASNGLRVSINQTRNRQREQRVTFADLVYHHIDTELACHLSGQEKSHATRVAEQRLVNGTWFMATELHGIPPNLWK